MMENLFDSLCSCLMLSSNRERFLKGEGLQLMNLMLRCVPPRRLTDPSWATELGGGFTPSGSQMQGMQGLGVWSSLKPE